MNLDTLLWLAIGGLMLTTITSCGIKGLYDFSRRELENYCLARQNRQRYTQIIDECDQVVLGVENLRILGQTLFLIVGLLWLIRSEMLRPKTIDEWIIVPIFVAGGILLFATVWLPGTIVHIWSAPFLYHTWRIWKSTAWILKPMTQGAHAVDLILHRLAGKQRQRPSEEEFEDEIRLIAAEALRDGHIEEDTLEMIEGIIELSDVDVADIMTPRSEVDAMDIALSWPRMLEFVTTVRRTRIPVFEKDRDNIIGILHVKDLLPVLAQLDVPYPNSVRELLRTAAFVPRSKPVDDLLQEFQRSRNHIAIVVDEYMSVDGVVTIEDVLEEIVGEIVDEYDTEDNENDIYVSNGSVELMARVHIDQINEQLGLNLPEDDEFDTIGGFVSVRLGHIPKVGERLKLDNTSITVLEASGRRVERVRIELPVDAQRESV